MKNLNKILIVGLLFGVSTFSFGQSVGSTEKTEKKENKSKEEMSSVKSASHEQTMSQGHMEVEEKVMTEDPKKILKKKMPAVAPEEQVNKENVIKD